jgi:hypothetical protein
MLQWDKIPIHQSNKKLNTGWLLKLGEGKMTIHYNTERVDGNRERVLFGATPDLTSPVPSFHSSSSHFSLLALSQFFISILQYIL